MRSVLLMSAAAAASVGVWAQTVPDNIGLLGMGREQIDATFKNAQRVRSPRRLSSGALGTLRIPDVLCEGARFEQTLFFGHDKLEQMEMVLADPRPGERDSASAFDAMVVRLRRELGPELGASASATSVMADAASWVSSGADVMLFRSGRPERPVVRLIIKQQRLVDASEL